MPNTPPFLKLKYGPWILNIPRRISRRRRKTGALNFTKLTNYHCTSTGKVVRAPLNTSNGKTLWYNPKSVLD